MGYVEEARQYWAEEFIKAVARNWNLAFWVEHQWYYHKYFLHVFIIDFFIFQNRLLDMRGSSKQTIWVNLTYTALPKTVENPQASSTMAFIFMWGDSKTVFDVWKCKFATASTFGKMQVDIIKANMWTAIKRTVQAENVIRRLTGTCKQKIKVN